MIIYITMIITKKSITCPQINTNSSSSIDSNNQISDIKLIYDDRPSITYKKMFENPEIGFGHQDFDAMDSTEFTHFYTKTNK